MSSHARANRLIFVVSSLSTSSRSAAPGISALAVTQWQRRGDMVGVGLVVGHGDQAPAESSNQGVVNSGSDSLAVSLAMSRGRMRRFGLGADP